MKILHITTHLSYGAGKAAVRLHESLLDKGIDSHILCLYPDLNPIKKSSQVKRKDFLFRILQKVKLIISKEKKNQLLLSGQTKRYETFTFCESDFDITQHSEYKNADIINLHWIGNLLDFPSFFSKNTKPIVWSLSDMNSFTGGCHYSKGCLKFINEECHYCPQLEGTKDLNSSHINIIIKKNSLLRLKSKIIIIPPANWLNSLSKSSMLFNGLPHTTIPHATDESIYKPLEKNFCLDYFKLPKNKIILLFSSGSLKSERKGFQLLETALQIINNPNIHLLIIGKNDIKINLNDNLYTCLGYINDEKVLNIAYNASSAVVISSLEDNLPLTLLDSMTCGKPSITYNIGGMEDNVINRVNGIKANELTVSSLSNAIKEFVEFEKDFDPSIIRKNALEKYSKTIHANKYIKVYNEILN